MVKGIMVEIQSPLTQQVDSLLLAVVVLVALVNRCRQVQLSVASEAQELLQLSLALQ
jgi:hypothetical protein